MDSNSEIQGYNVYPMLHFCRKFSSSVTPYNWKLTPMTHSKLLTPSISKCPSSLGLKFLSRERFGGFLESKIEHLEK